MSNSTDLKVKIVQIVGDQASGIISVAKNMFSSRVDSSSKNLKIAGT